MSLILEAGQISYWITKPKTRICKVRFQNEIRLKSLNLKEVLLQNSFPTTDASQSIWDIDICQYHLFKKPISCINLEITLNFFELSI